MGRFLTLFIMLHNSKFFEDYEVWIGAGPNLVLKVAFNTIY